MILMLVVLSRLIQVVPCFAPPVLSSCFASGTSAFSHTFFFFFIVPFVV